MGGPVHQSGAYPHRRSIAGITLFFILKRVVPNTHFLLCRPLPSQEMNLAVNIILDTAGPD